MRIIVNNMYDFSYESSSFAVRSVDIDEYGNPTSDGGGERSRTVYGIQINGKDIVGDYGSPLMAEMVLKYIRRAFTNKKDIIYLPVTEKGAEDWILGEGFV